MPAQGFMTGAEKKGSLSWSVICCCQSHLQNNLCHVRCGPHKFTTLSGWPVGRVGVGGRKRKSDSEMHPLSMRCMRLASLRGGQGEAGTRALQLCRQGRAEIRAGG
jgi:hypothetical protein